MASALAENVRYGYGVGWSFTPLSGKRPVLSGWQERSRETLEEALDWASKGNVGLRTGKASGGIVVIDQDPGGDVSKLSLPATVTATTGRPGGMHRYFRTPAPIGNSSGRLGPHIDIKAERGQVVFPGSIHPETGVRYEWVEGLEPWNVPVAELPAHIIAMLQGPPRPDGGSEPHASEPPNPPLPLPGNGAPDPYAAKALRDELAAVASAPVGARNDTLNKAAFSLGTLIGAGYLDRSEVEAALKDAAHSAGLSGYEIEATIRSGVGSGMKHPRVVEPKDHPMAGAALGSEVYGDKGAWDLASQAKQRTDLGNAARFVLRAGKDFRFCPQWGKWLYWDRIRWRVDDGLRVMAAAKRVALSIFDEAKEDVTKDDREAIAKWAVASQTRAHIEAIVSLSRSELAVMVDDFDKDIWVLNLLNGTLDLRTGELHPHSREDLITKLAPVRFDPAAASPLWDAFLQRVMDHVESLIGYLQRFAGVCLTGDVREQVLLMLYGQGANGKSVFVDTLLGLLGDYAGEAAPDLLMERKNPEHPTELADLCGRRLVVTSETEEGRRLRVQLVKRLTGNQRIKARHMREDFFDFPRTHKLILVTNNRPAIPESTHAVWRRIRLLPFNVIIPDDEQDKELLTKLKAEWPGVLNWAVKGCLNWQRDGLQTPEDVELATQEYEDEQDRLAEFFEERCVVVDGAFTTRTAIYAAYQEWATKAHERYPLDRTGLYDRMRKRSGVTEGQKRLQGRPVRGFLNLGLQAVLAESQDIA